MGNSVCNKILVHVVIFFLMISYWVYEIMMFIVWASFGIGFSKCAAGFANTFAPEKMSHAWENCVMMHILAGGAVAQTLFHLASWERIMRNLKMKARMLYLIYRVWPLIILVVYSLGDMFVQFRIRYEKKSLTVEEENAATVRFLLAICILTYILGRKARIDFKYEVICSRLDVFYCGRLKYAAMFILAHIIEGLMLFVWGGPVILLGIGFGYYYFNPFLTYISLIVLGILLGVTTAGLSVGETYLKPFGNEPAMKYINAEIKPNILLFTVAPFLSKWYFSIGFPFNSPSYEDGRKINFILFSIHVAFLLMTFMRQSVHLDKYLADRNDALVRVEVVDIPDAGGVNNNPNQEIVEATASQSTGVFSIHSGTLSSVRFEEVEDVKQGDQENANIDANETTPAVNNKAITSATVIENNESSQAQNEVGTETLTSTKSNIAQTSRDPSSQNIIHKSSGIMHMPSKIPLLRRSDSNDNGNENPGPSKTRRNLISESLSFNRQPNDTNNNISNASNRPATSEAILHKEHRSRRPSGLQGKDEPVDNNV